ncbi:hypothetical protein [Marinobacter caseinilyticus]|uniref:hypothetical protein n=1 Tax=Marinobacter caseinilyticus TaxID=2692195 RepID=UPI0014081BDD|nr:hypothetical protein [Marinobacter caseinilyticus]
MHLETEAMERFAGPVVNNIVRKEGVNYVLTMAALLVDRVTLLVAHCLVRRHTDHSAVIITTFSMLSALRLNRYVPQPHGILIAAAEWRPLPNGYRFLA